MNKLFITLMDKIDEATAEEKQFGIVTKNYRMTSGPIHEIPVKVKGVGPELKAGEVVLLPGVSLTDEAKLELVLFAQSKARESAIDWSDQPLFDKVDECVYMPDKDWFVVRCGPVRMGGIKVRDGGKSISSSIKPDKDWIWRGHFDWNLKVLLARAWKEAQSKKPAAAVAAPVAPKPAAQDPAEIMAAFKAAASIPIKVVSVQPTSVPVAPRGFVPATQVDKQISFASFTTPGLETQEDGEMSDEVSVVATHENTDFGV